MHGASVTSNIGKNSLRYLKGDQCTVSFAGINVDMSIEVPHTSNNIIQADAVISGMKKVKSFPIVLDSHT